MKTPVKHNYNYFELSAVLYTILLNTNLKLTNGEGGHGWSNKRKEDEWRRVRTEAEENAKSNKSRERLGLLQKSSISLTL